MLLSHLFAGPTSSLRKRFAVCGLLDPLVGEPPLKTRKRPEPRVGDLHSTNLLDRWRHGSFTAPWWKQFFCNAAVWEQDTWWYFEFRKKFRVPPCIYRELKAETSCDKRFADSGSPACSKQKGPPRASLDMKMVASLRILATGCQFDAFEEAAGLDKETLRRFFHDWMQHLAVNVAPLHIKLPEGEELRSCAEVYRKLGFPGAIMSTDATHVPWDRVPCTQHANHTGKEKFPSLVWNAHVTHDRQFRHVAQAQPGARNDKTLAHYDWLMQSIKGGLFGEETFNLYDSDGIPQQHKGFYLICDGGYHMWRCLQFPLKYAQDIWARRWSKRLESVRKDVECAFGILKQRFRILKIPFQLKGACLPCGFMCFYLCCIQHPFDTRTCL